MASIVWGEATSEVGWRASVILRFLLNIPIDRFGFAVDVRVSTAACKPAHYVNEGAWDLSNRIAR